MNCPSYRAFTHLSTKVAKGKIREYLETSAAIEAKKYPDLDEKHLPRKYLDTIMTAGHCVLRHGSNDYDKLLDRLIENPPTLNNPDSKFSTFDSKEKAYYVVNELLYSLAGTLGAKLADYTLSHKENITLTKGFGEPCGCGIMFNKGKILFGETGDVTIVLNVDKENELNDLHCVVCTAYPDLTHCEINKEKSKEFTKSFYEKLLNHPSNTLRQAWALILSGYNINTLRDSYLASIYGEDSWDNRKVSAEFRVLKKETKEPYYFSVLFHEHGNVSYSLYRPETKDRRKIDELKVPTLIREEVLEIKEILRNPNTIIRDRMEQTIDNSNPNHDNVNDIPSRDDNDIDER